MRVPQNTVYAYTVIYITQRPGMRRGGDKGLEACCLRPRFAIFIQRGCSNAAMTIGQRFKRHQGQKKFPWYEGRMVKIIVMSPRQGNHLHSTVVTWKKSVRPSAKTFCWCSSNKSQTGPCWEGVPAGGSAELGGSMGR